MLKWHHGKTLDSLWQPRPEQDEHDNLLLNEFAITSVASDVVVKLLALGCKLLPFAFVVIGPRSLAFAISFLAFALLVVVGCSIAILAFRLAFAVFSTAFGSLSFSFGILSTLLSFSFLFYSINFHGNFFRRNWKKVAPTLLRSIPFEKTLSKLHI